MVNGGLPEPGSDSKEGKRGEGHCGGGAAGVEVYTIDQTPGQVVLLDGDVIHGGVCSLVNSVNEAINFLPVRWLTQAQGLALLPSHWTRQRRGLRRRLVDASNEVCKGRNDHSLPHPQSNVR